MDVTTTKLFRVKATRANPPGLAQRPERHGTYAAALAQFEELLASARSAGAASRPLPLFYALSQAGRAISAAVVAEGLPWKLRGHGLSAPDLDHRLTEIVVRLPNQQSNGKPTTTIDSFGGVAGLFDGEPIKKPVKVGEVWASVPEVQHLLSQEFDSYHERPAWLIPDDPGGFATPAFPWGRVDATVVGLGVAGEDVAELLNARYLPPGAPEARLFLPQGVGPISAWSEKGSGFRVSFTADAPNYEGHLRTIARIHRAAVRFEPLTLMPKVGDAHVTRLGRWWLLLYALSMVARYEPARWTATLNFSESALAAPTEEVLHVALDVVPDLVWEALSWARDLPNEPETAR